MARGIISTVGTLLLLAMLFGSYFFVYALADSERNLAIKVMESDGKTKVGGADCRIIVFSAANTVIETKNLVSNGGGNINTNMVERGAFVQVDCTTDKSSGLDVASVNGEHTVHMIVYLN